MSTPHTHKLGAAIDVRWHEDGSKNKGLQTYTKCVQQKTDEEETPAFSYHKIFNMHISPTQIARVYYSQSQEIYYMSVNMQHIQDLSQFQVLLVALLLN